MSAALALPTASGGVDPFEAAAWEAALGGVVKKSKGGLEDDTAVAIPSVLSVKKLVPAAPVRRGGEEEEEEGDDRKGKKHHKHKSLKRKPEH